MPVKPASPSLLLRLLLLSTLAVLAGVALSTWLGLQRAEQDLLDSHRRQRADELLRTARLLESRIETQRTVLAAAAPAIAPALRAGDARLEATLRGLPVLLGQFDSVFVIAPDGRMAIIHDDRGMRSPGTELADRPYFRRAMDEGKASLSEVLDGRVNGELVVVMAEPLRHEGAVVGVLAGGLRLRSHPLLQGLQDDLGGHTRTVLALADTRGRIAAHPQREAIGQPLAREHGLAEAEAHWRAAGAPWPAGPLHLDTPEWLSTVVGMPSTGWTLWLSQPRADVLAPLAAARRSALRHAAAVSTAVMTLLALLLWRELAPLRALRARAARLFEGPADAGWPEGRGEVGDLAAALRQALRAQEAQSRALRLQHQELQTVLAAAPLGIVKTRRRCIELASPQAQRLLARSEQALAGQPAQILYASNEDYLAMGPRVAEAFARREPFAGEVEMLRGDGRRFWVRLTGQPVDWDDADAGTIWTLEDISAQVQERARLEWAAQHDALTGLANRAALLARLGQIFGAPASAQPAALLLLDLDGFKAINDRHGHAAGDAMLRAVAQALAGCLRGGDLAARLGGDEFAVVLEQCPADVARRIAETMRQALTELRLDWDGQTLQVGASFGVAALTEALDTPAAWLAAADAACYAAKAAGRNAVRCAGHAPVRLVGPRGAAA